MSRRSILPGAGESFVSFIALFDGPSVWPASLSYALPPPSFGLVFVFVPVVVP
jgi:hypothetical protein